MKIYSWSMIFREAVQNSEVTHFNSRLGCTSARYLISWATTETVSMCCVSRSKSNIAMHCTVHSWLGAPLHEYSFNIWNISSHTSIYKQLKKRIPFTFHWGKCRKVDSFDFTISVLLLGLWVNWTQKYLSGAGKFTLLNMQCPFFPEKE